MGLRIKNYLSGITPQVLANVKNLDTFITLNGLHQCPCNKCVRCKMDEPCLECEEYSTWIEDCLKKKPLYIHNPKTFSNKVKF